MTGAADSLTMAQAVFQHVSDGIILIDGERRIRAMNPAARELLGDQAADMARDLCCATCLDCRSPAGRELAPGDGCRCLEALSGGQPIPYFELNIQDADGRRIPMAVSASLVPLDGEQLVAVVMRDVRERARLESELAQRGQEAEFLYRLSRDLASLQDFESGVRTALDRLRVLLDIHVAGWIDLDETGDHLLYRALVGHTVDFSHLRVPVAESLHGEGIRQGRMLISSDLAAEAAEWPGRAPLLLVEGVRSSVMTPLVSRGQVLGSLVLGCRNAREFNVGELRLAQAVADQVAVAVDNYRLYGRLHDTAVAEERHRLAAEIHDSLAQTIAIIGQRVRQLPDLIQRTGPDEAAAFAGGLQRVVDQAHREVRQAIFDLRSPAQPGASFLESLREYLEEFGIIHRLDVQVLLPPATELALPLQVEVHVLRIIQESLHNVRKHSGAQQVIVRFDRRAPGLLTVRVEDNGTGFEPSARTKRHHYGLQIMQDRAKAIGGILTVRARPGGGTVVELEIPLAKE